MTHDLKTWPEYYQKIVDGSKPFELRKDDRHFQEGDTLVLHEWDSIDGYSGASVTKTITYVLRCGGSMGLEKGYVIMGIK